ncbi:MAG TPA: hypothetical protein IGS52_11750 [Oscillatoriaceae cyanobacterium M33_DOE_052]|uniref:Flagellar assembly protein H n=1 Tax=Planktothricoides sp. SpSt-374 TaxID=2282167 RepID=A0A7C3VKM8_9CYAN|nr:hypothetical protein [Oscillatoriaceae cyanobacterium M33_DOE_052]
MHNGDRQYLKTIFQPFGQTEADEPLESEQREIDILFTPDPEKAPAANHLGLLGRLAATPAAFEFFSHPVKPHEISNSLVKILDLNEELEGNATEENRTLTEAELAHLWIFTPTASAAVLADFGATLDLENWMSGIYFLPKGLLSAIIVIHELPPTPETLCLRILGMGEVRKQALQELSQLPPEHPIRSTALKLLEQFRTSLETQPDLSPEEKEFLMELSPLDSQPLVPEEWS